MAGLLDLIMSALSSDTGMTPEQEAMYPYGDPEFRKRQRMQQALEGANDPLPPSYLTAQGGGWFSGSPRWYGEVPSGATHEDIARWTDQGHDLNDPAVMAELIQMEREGMPFTTWAAQKSGEPYAANQTTVDRSLPFTGPPPAVAAPEQKPTVIIVDALGEQAVKPKKKKPTPPIGPWDTVIMK